MRHLRGAAGADADEVGAKMSDLRQAAQQALEALESRGASRELHHHVITALRTALEQQAEPMVCQCRRCIKEHDIREPSSNLPLDMTRMILCPTCGNKRCPKASDHRLDCTDSNAAGQPGSVYPAPTQQQAEPVTSYTLNTTKTAAVAAEFYWSPIGEDTPRGVKILLLGRGGVASLGHYHHKPGESEFWTHWAPLPKKP